MLKRGMDVSEISEIIGFSSEEIEQLKSELDSKTEMNPVSLRSHPSL